MRRIYTWLEASIAAHQTVGVETVLSTDKYRNLVLAAKARHVILKSADLNVERVRIRVAEGGHHFAKRKIIERRERSLQQLPWFLEHADGAWSFDNSGSKPRLIGTKLCGNIVLDAAALPEIRNAAAQVGAGRQMPLPRP